MDKKKIEPTDAMVEEALFQRPITPDTTRAILRAALNHPDTPGLFAFEFVDALRAAREQGWDQAVDWIKRDQGGPSGRTTNARNANPHRPAQDLPTKPGAVIVRADGHKYIEAVVSGVTWRTREAVLGWDERWYGVWRSSEGVLAYVIPEHIIPDTCKVDDQ